MGAHSKKLLFWAGLADPVSIPVSRPRTYCLFVARGQLNG